MIEKPEQPTKVSGDNLKFSDWKLEEKIQHNRNY
jgi:hypothetical protein